MPTLLSQLKLDLNNLDQVLILNIRSFILKSTDKIVEIINMIYIMKFIARSSPIYIYFLSRSHRLISYPTQLI